MRYGVLPWKTIKQPTQLLRRHLQGRIILRVFRPDEATLFKAPIMQPESIGIPMQYFEFIAATAAKNKPMRTDRIALHTFDNEHGKAINRFTHISHAGRQVDMPSRCVPHQTSAARMVGSS